MHKNDNATSFNRLVTPAQFFSSRSVVKSHKLALVKQYVNFILKKVFLS